MDFNSEAVLDELNYFEDRHQAIPPVLDEYLKKVANTGDILFPWIKLKPLIKRKLEHVVNEFHDSSPFEVIPSFPNTDPFDFEVAKKNLVRALDGFTSAPFTIQRVCELITNPQKYYNRTDKFMRGLEKNLFVVSTLESNATETTEGNQYQVTNGNINSIDLDIISNRSQNSDIASFPISGPKLDNFETVFHSANRLVPPRPNISHQVAVISDNTYNSPEVEACTTYKCNENSQSLDTSDAKIILDNFIKQDKNQETVVQSSIAPKEEEKSVSKDSQNKICIDETLNDHFPMYKLLVKADANSASSSNICLSSLPIDTLECKSLSRESSSAGDFDPEEIETSSKAIFSASGNSFSLEMSPLLESGEIKSHISAKDSFGDPETKAFLDNVSETLEPTAKRTKFNVSIDLCVNKEEEAIPAAMSNHDVPIQCSVHPRDGGCIGGNPVEGANDPSTDNSA